jgi:hypothetical protein
MDRNRPPIRERSRLGARQLGVPSPHRDRRRTGLLLRRTTRRHQQAHCRQCHLGPPPHPKNHNGGRGVGDHLRHPTPTPSRSTKPTQYSLIEEKSLPDFKNAPQAVLDDRIAR